MLPLHIAIPAWGAPYVEIATRFTVPAVRAALLTRGASPPPTFLIHTDDAAAFRRALPGADIRFPSLKIDPRQRDATWIAFKRAHREAIEMTPAGAVVALLNSDIVVSEETFRVVDDIFADARKKVIVSVGIRTLYVGPATGVPLGVGAEELARWIWAHRHPITDDCIWGRGSTGHPTILFFEAAGAVTMHGFHMTPMFLRKDDRNAAFAGTIDDDLLEHYGDDEIHFMTAREAMFAELSPRNKTHRRDPRLDVRSVVGFGKPRFSSAHIRNFQQSFKVLGEPRRPAAVDAIIAGLRA